MNVVKWSMAVLLAAALPSVAAAQDPQDRDAFDDTPAISLTDSHWLLSGSVGSDFGSDADEASVNFGANLGYLWRGVIGGEFAASFSPDFQLEPGRSALLGGANPMINSYMANVIGALPLGPDGQYRPYVSGGVGGLTLASDVLGEADAFEVDDAKFGGNVGVGFLGFAESWGFRGDVRYYRGFQRDEGADPIESPEEAIGSQVLSELGFWRANIGVALRF